MDSSVLGHSTALESHICGSWATHSAVHCYLLKGLKLGLVFGVCLKPGGRDKRRVILWTALDSRANKMLSVTTYTATRAAEAPDRSAGTMERSSVYYRGIMNVS